MKKQEALDHFNETYVKKISSEKLADLEEYYKEHKDDLADKFIKSIKEICFNLKKMQTQNEKGKIAYIMYSFLRTEILEKRYNYLIEALDEDWFLDYKECHSQYDATWAFKYLEEFEDTLQESRKIYAGQINESDIEKIKLKEVKKYNEYIVEIARYALRKEDIKELKDIKKEEVLEISIGEYRDLIEPIYKEDNRKKDSKEVKEWLEEKLENEYSYEVYNNLDLSHGDYESIDFRYSNFKETNLEKSNMKESILIGVKFSNCNLKEVDFSNSDLSKAEFEHVNLKDANFQNAVLPKEYKNKLNLDEEQIQCIYWE